MLVERLTLWLARTNAWIIAPRGRGGECVLVDAPPEPSVLLDRLAALDLRVVAILATHGHVDHVGGIGAVVGAHHPHPPVHINEHDRFMLADPRTAGGPLAEHLGDLGVSPPEVVLGLDDGDVVSGAGLTFTALHTVATRQVRSVCASTSTARHRGCSAATTSSPARSGAPTSPVDPSRRSWRR